MGAYEFVSVNVCKKSPIIDYVTGERSGEYELCKDVNDGNCQMFKEKTFEYEQRKEQLLSVYSNKKRDKLNNFWDIIGDFIYWLFGF